MHKTGPTVGSLQGFFRPRRHHWTPPSHAMGSVRPPTGLECHPTERSGYGGLLERCGRLHHDSPSRWCHAQARRGGRPDLAQQHVFQPIPNPSLSESESRKPKTEKRAAEWGKPTTTPGHWEHGPIRGSGISDLHASIWCTDVSSLILEPWRGF